MTTEALTPEVVRQFDEVAVKSGLQKDSALQLRDQFKTHYEDIADLRVQADTITDPENPVHTKLSREVRLMLREVRCDVENVRKALKADSLARGKAIDGYANVLKYMCEPVEERLLAIEQHEERKEQARIAALVEERSAALRAEDVDPSAYNLGVMDDATWDTTIAIAKQRKADRIEAERKAEADRLAREKADREARAKAEAEAKEARAQAEAERKARVAAEAKAKAEREAAEEVARREKAKADAALAKEREARQKAERDAAEAKRKEAERVAEEKAAAEAKAKAEAEAQAAAARAPDREKIMAFADSVRGMADVFPTVATEAGKSVRVVIVAQIEKFALWIEKQAETL